MDELALLQLMQIADSAVPIGAAAHSMGLEALVEEQGLEVPDLERFFMDYLAETGTWEAAGCYRAHRLARAETFSSSWCQLNRTLSARKPARESRSASGTLGRRVLQLAFDLTGDPVLSQGLQAAKAATIEVHHCAAFGLIGASLGLSEQTAAAAYLHQSLTGLVSACQRLMPLGQQAASGLLWRLKPAVVAAARNADKENVPSFLPLPEIAAMRHPTLPTRLFIS